MNLHKTEGRARWVRVLGFLRLSKEFEYTGNFTTPLPVHSPIKTMGLEDYKIIRCVGKGSFGKVYLCRHIRVSLFVLCNPFCFVHARFCFFKLIPVLFVTNPLLVNTGKQTLLHEMHQIDQHSSGGTSGVPPRSQTHATAQPPQHCWLQRFLLCQTWFPALYRHDVLRRW